MQQFPLLPIQIYTESVFTFTHKNESIVAQCIYYDDENIFDRLSQPLREKQKLRSCCSHSFSTQLRFDLAAAFLSAEFPLFLLEQLQAKPDAKLGAGLA